MPHLSQNVSDNCGPFRIKDSNELPFRPGRVQQWAKQVENGPHLLLRQTFSHRRERAERRMIGPGKNETEAVLLQTLVQLFRGKIDCDAELLQTVGASATRGDSTIAMFRDYSAAGRNHKHRGRRNVEKTEAVARSEERRV